MKPDFPALSELGLTPSAFWTAAWQQSTQSNPRQGDDAAEEAFWRDFAPGYDEKSPLAQRAGTVVADAIALLEKTDTVLEIGPGSGAFTRLVVPHVASLAGIEPSAAMQAEFRRCWPDALGPLPELSLSKWEDAAPPATPPAVIFTCNAVYRIADMEAALRKMDATASRHVVMIQTIGHPYASPLKLTREGRDYERERAHAISDILDELSIAHHLRTYTVERRPDSSATSRSSAGNQAAL